MMAFQSAETPCCYSYLAETVLQCDGLSRGATRPRESCRLTRSSSRSVAGIRKCPTQAFGKTLAYFQHLSDFNWLMKASGGPNGLKTAL